MCHDCQFDGNKDWYYFFAFDVKTKHKLICLCSQCSGISINTFYYLEEKRITPKLDNEAHWLGLFSFNISVYCLSNQQFKRLGGPLGEIVTVSVHKHNVFMPRRNTTSMI